MNWYRRYLSKLAQLTAPEQLETPSVQQPPVPQGYWDIGDAGHHDFDNPDCAIFVWRAGPNGIEIEEVLHKDQDHDYLFPGMNRERAYFGRYNQCTGQASLAVPTTRAFYTTPPALVQSVVSQFKRYGLKQIWEFRDNAAPTKVWG